MLKFLLKVNSEYVTDLERKTRSIPTLSCTLSIRFNSELGINYSQHVLISQDFMLTVQISYRQKQDSEISLRVCPSFPHSFILVSEL